MAWARLRNYHSPLSENTLYYDYSPRPSPRDPRGESLADIIDVDPCSASFTCVGWAPTKHRRCEHRIAWPNRCYASRLLEDSTIEFLHEEDIRCILEELAPRVLCRRRHQYQASEMVHKWLRLVTNHLEDQRARARATRHLPRRRHHLRIAEYSPERDLQFPAWEEPRRPFRAGQAEVFPTPRPSPSPQPLTRQVLGIDHQLPSPTASVEAVVELNQPGSITYAERRRIRPDDTCPICQEHLTRTPAVSLPSRTLNGNDIAWCRARCGTNFHNSCINEWRAAGLGQVTCPCW